MRPLAKCVIGELRLNPEMGAIAIDFGIKGSGRVSEVRVNDRTEGQLYQCVSERMRMIQFPEFDGAVTWASFEIKVRR